MKNSIFRSHRRSCPSGVGAAIAAVPLLRPYEGFYDDNTGKAKVTIKRLVPPPPLARRRPDCPARIRGPLRASRLRLGVRQEFSASANPRGSLTFSDFFDEVCCFAALE